MNADQMLEIARMRLQGMPLDEIARELGYSRKDVVKGMNKLIRYLRGRKVTKVDVIYPNIRRALQEKCMTFQELADEAGIYKETLHYIMTGKTRSPRLGTKQLIADALGLTVDEAFAKEEGNK